MPNDYRINVRFHFNNPKEKAAAEYLQSLQGKSRNRFAVEAITAAINKKQASTFSLEDIRSIFKEELQNASFVSAGEHTISENEKIENMQNVLSDLDMFE